MFSVTRTVFCGKNDTLRGTASLGLCEGGDVTLVLSGSCCSFCLVEFSLRIQGKEVTRCYLRRRGPHYRWG